MAFKDKDKIKEEIIEAVQNAENFDDMMGKAAVYIQANYESKMESAVTVDDGEIVSLK